MKLSGALFAVLVIAIGIAATVEPPTAAARDYDCADFASQAEAQEYLEPGDPYNLDADSDGIACESNPCPCVGEGGSGGGGSAGGGAVPPPPPPPFHLPKAAARHAALVVAKKFVRRSAQVSRLTLGVCRRLAERRVDCFGAATGTTAETKTSCQLRIAVRARDRHPKARLVGSKCRTQSTARLTAAEALAAFRSRGAELAGKAVGIFQLERLSLVAFRGLAEWTRRSEAKPPVSEECFALMEATRRSGGVVSVGLLEMGCEQSVVP